MIYYAHSSELDKSKWQTVKDHLENTARLALSLGEDTGLSEFAYIVASLHDIGKYSQAFHRRLDGSKHRVDHATAGVQEITQIFKTEPQKVFANLLACCITGHHEGLTDYGSVTDVVGEGTLLARLDLDKTKLQDYLAYKTEINISKLNFQPRLIKPIKDHRNFSVSFLARMVFSTLVDADWLETETYMNGGRKPRGEYESIETLCERFNRSLQKFDNPQNDINQKFTETLKTCMEKSVVPQRLFTLINPGDALVSLRGEHFGGGRQPAVAGKDCRTAVDDTVDGQLRSGCGSGGTGGSEGGH